MFEARTVKLLALSCSIWDGECEIRCVPARQADTGLTHSEPKFRCSVQILQVCNKVEFEFSLLLRNVAEGYCRYHYAHKSNKWMERSAFQRPENEEGFFLKTLILSSNRAWNDEQTQSGNSRNLLLSVLLLFFYKNVPMGCKDCQNHSL